MKRIWLLLGIVALSLGCGGSGGGSDSPPPGPTQNVFLSVHLFKEGLTDEQANVRGVFPIPMTIADQSAELAKRLDALLRTRLNHLGQGSFAGRISVVIGASQTDPINDLQIVEPIVVDGAVQTFSVGGQTLTFRQYLEYRFLNTPNASLYTSVTLFVGT